MKRKLWVIFLAIFLFLYAVFALTNLELVYAPYIMGVLALITAIALVIDR